ncbi:MAG: hypothetical protein K9G67_02855 [Bacteroidales bacterium]|nr:hypothetical protein [Bacteroidales bacterium]MCF8345214.1 hypothetical protein [Bacteroidales bacterium]MCF8351849.1 hypothetical protein [Bacteroidales bacterium]MCF8375268.1 hypothetical protein [Bacteroidales bacterium]MCF8401258.1 hypothetical protein [Bacteroidales bacterium]
MKVNPVFFGVFVLGMLLVNTKANSQQNVFDSLFAKVDSLAKNGLYYEALGLITGLQPQYADNWFELSKEKIYLNEKLGHNEENLTIFRNGHQKGWFYFIHPALAKYDPYKELPGFDSIAWKDMELREAALIDSRTIYEVEQPCNCCMGKSHPVMLIFHGGGSNLARVKEHWHSPILDSCFINIYLQSYRHYDSQTYGWRSGDPRADEDIRNILRDVIQKYDVDTNAIYLSGISAGGTYALDILLRNVMPAKGGLLFCPGMPYQFEELYKNEKLNFDFTLYMVGGEYDFYLEKQKMMLPVFKEAKLHYLHVIVPGLDHRYPPDEDYYIDEALKYFFNQSP